MITDARADEAFDWLNSHTKALGEAKRADGRPQYCDACFTGDYPTTLTDQDDVVVTNQLELLAERVA